MYYALCTMHNASCIMHYASWIMHHVSCIMHHASKKNRWKKMLVKKIFGPRKNFGPKQFWFKIFVCLFVTDCNTSARAKNWGLKDFLTMLKKCRKGGIMQALYATSAWACCFYVFMFFTLFLWEGWWIFFHV